jgi:hypothetical protein
LDTQTEKAREKEGENESASNKEGSKDMELKVL